MTTCRSIFLLVMCFAMLCAAQFCASDGNDPVPTWDPSDVCTTQAFANLTPPPIRNLTSGAAYAKHDCSIAVLLDLDQNITSVTDYNNVLLFLKGMTNTCMDRGIGYQSFFYPMFNKSVAPTICCGEVVCAHQIGFMNYYDYVGHYENQSAVQHESAKANFTYTLLADMKPLAQTNTRCLYNSIVMITNRVFNYTPGLDTDVSNIIQYGCISFTIIAVGNPEITSEIMEKYYSKLTTNQYVVPNFNCLPNLNDCIKPCGPRSQAECQSAQHNLSHCRPPTTPAPTTTVKTTTPVPPTIDSRYMEYWHIIYLFALSNRTSTDQFQRAITFVEEPIKTCIDDKTKIVVRFLAKNMSDSGWLDNDAAVHSHLESLKREEVLLDSSGAIDVYDTTTLNLVIWATSLPVPEDKSINGPTLILLTDFVSQNFLDAYNNNSDNSLIKSLQKFDFEIYCFDEKAAEIYRNDTEVKRTHIHSDPNFGDTDGSLIELCNAPKKTSIPTILIIIVGTCTGGMLLLIVATILYRQKLMWIQKLNRFKSKLNDDEEAEEDIIDYWEMSWEKLIVKNEKLGHGAYGQVFKGKVIGAPPGILQFNRQDAPLYTDCDCAVKMLPKHASESARAEFMHEISLMKTLGCNDHIVNMLGCVTSTSKSCLVLEFCKHRDLLRYLKQKKVELEISKSIDDQIECTKEFLNFAWEIAQGMSFLGHKNIIHRDLAARNIMITGNLDALKAAKIGDFGLAIDASPTDNPVSASGRLPIKWLAIESLIKGVFSFKSDVWSFGIVLFEMWSMGAIPFADIEPTDLIAHLQEGHRPKRPLLATDDKLADIMQRCWDKNPDDRPTFEEILAEFRVLLEQATEGYGYLALIKSSEYYRVLADVHDETGMDNLYADGPCRPRTASSYSNQSRIQIDGNPNNGGGIPRLPKINIETFDGGPAGEQEYDEIAEDRSEGSAKEPVNWADRMRRRKSQIAQLNPFRKIIRKATHDARRGSVPY